MNDPWPQYKTSTLSFKHRLTMLQMTSSQPIAFMLEKCRLISGAQLRHANLQRNHESVVLTCTNYSKILDENPSGGGANIKKVGVLVIS